MVMGNRGARWSTRRRWIAGGTAVLVLAGGGSASAAAFGGDSSGSSPSGSGSSGGTASAQSSKHSSARFDDRGMTDRQEERAVQKVSTVTVRQAIKTAQQHVPHATLLSAEQDEDNGHVVWDVSLLTRGGKERDLNIDAGNAKVLSNRVDTDDGDDREDHAEDRALARATHVTPSDALRTAERKVPSGTVTSLDLDDRNDQPIWEVELATHGGVTSHEFAVDGVHGKVRGHEVDHEDND